MSDKEECNFVQLAVKNVRIVVLGVAVKAVVVKNLLLKSSTLEFSLMSYSVLGALIKFGLFLLAKIHTFHLSITTPVMSTPLIY